VRSLILSLSLLLLATGCGRHNSCSYGVAPAASASHVLPRVAILPVVNECGEPLPWRLSDELTERFGTTFARREGMTLLSPEVGRALAAELEHVDLFSPTLRDLRGDGRCDVLVATELIDHELVPYRGQKIQQLYAIDGEVGSILMMKLRLRVIDLRGESPKVVLQEIVNSNHLVRRRDEAIDYLVHGWGAPQFAETAVGIAHERLAEDTAGRVAQYVSVMR
jgi:hypothetical protein